MRIPTSRENNGLRDDSSMTSMIDVVFLLLIFFVCASLGQMGELLVSTEMAAGSIDSAEFEKQPKPFGEVWIFLRRENGETTVQINQGGTTFRQGDADDFRSSTDFPKFVNVLKGLAAAEASVPVILDMQDGVPSGDLVAVFTTAKQVAGFQTINFKVEPTKKAR